MLGEHSDNYHDNDCRSLYKTFPLRPHLSRANMEKRSSLTRPREKTPLTGTETPALTGLVCRPAGKALSQREGLCPFSQDSATEQSLHRSPPSPSLTFSWWPFLLPVLGVSSLPIAACSLFINANSLALSPPPRLVGGDTAHAPSAPLPLHPHPHRRRLGLIPFSLSPSPPSLLQTLTPHYSSFPGFSFGLQPHPPEVRRVEGRPAEKGRGKASCILR